MRDSHQGREDEEPSDSIQRTPHALSDHRTSLCEGHCRMIIIEREKVEIEKQNDKNGLTYYKENFNELSVEFENIYKYVIKLLIVSTCIFAARSLPRANK